MKHAPECVNRSQCREIVINGQVPLDWALPLYGYIMPIIVAITLATNSFIVLVLSHKYLRTPTNFVLLAMAVSELLTGLSCLPWLLYYYTFKGYQTDQEYGLPPFWCSMFPYLASILPSIFHTAAIWLTVYLAVQRYIYICMPKLVKNHCTIARSRCVIMCIFMASAWIYAPELFATYNQSYEMESHRFYNRTYRVCMRVRTTFIQVVGSNAYYYILYGLHTVLAHTLPCILLVLFTCKLISAIRQADRRHAVLISKPREAYRKYTEGSIDPSSIEQVVTRKFSQLVRGRGSVNESRRVQGLKQ
ncbi:CBN-SPRR-1 protein, partial [Aphelenchoides avenae]